MILRRALASLVFLLALVFSAVSPLAWEPPRGSPVRSAIMEGLRPVVERDLGPPVLFNVVALNVEGPWAFVSVRATRPGGQPLDWSRTRYARAMASGQMSDFILALMRGDGQMWSVVEYALGPPTCPGRVGEPPSPVAAAVRGGLCLRRSAKSGGRTAPAAPASPAAAATSGRHHAAAAAGGTARGPEPGRHAPLDARRHQLRDSAHRQSLDLAQADLASAAMPGTPPCPTGRWIRGAASRRLLWSDDEFIYSRSLDQTNLLGTQASRLSGIPARKVYFSLRDRYNDARGFDVAYIMAEVQGGTLSMGCRAPNAHGSDRGDLRAHPRQRP